MWMTAVYLVLSFSVPLFSFVSGLGLPRLLTWLRSGVRSLDVVESFEMETRLQVQRETLETEQQRRFDEYFVDVEVCCSGPRTCSRLMIDRIELQFWTVS